MSAKHYKFSKKEYRMRYLILALLGACSVAQASGLEIGVGKALNNTNHKVPGWIYSGRVVVTSGKWSYDAAYTRMGISYLAKNAAISTIGVSRQINKMRYGFSVITGASYDPTVWWSPKHPERSCEIGDDDCGHKYKNDGVHFSRSCHMCGGMISADYSLTERLSARAEYYGLRHMNPTYQGVVLQLTYRLGG
jgi:hypothetical protein